MVRLCESGCLMRPPSLPTRSRNPLASTYLDGIGDEPNWAEIVALFTGAGQDWNSAAFFSVFDAEGLLEITVARFRLRQIEGRVCADCVKPLPIQDGRSGDRFPLLRVLPD